MFITNAVVIVLAQMLFPQAIVLGTHALSYWWAVGMSMSKLAILDAVVMPFVSMYEKKRRKIFSPKEWMALYFVVDLVGIWGISRFSEQFGLGISSWMVAVVLAVVLDFVQGVVMMAYGKMMKM